MLKHETLVLTLAAVERIEERLLFHMHRSQKEEKYFAGYMSVDAFDAETAMRNSTASNKIF